MINEFYTIIMMKKTKKYTERTPHMIHAIKEAFSSNGFFLDKRLMIHLSLQKGRENVKKLGSFDLNVEGCSHIARKAAILLLLSGVYFGAVALKRK